MRHPTRFVARPAAVLACLLAFASAARAAEPGVRDDARFFSPAVAQQADAKLKDLKQKFGHTVIVETFGTLPNELSGRVDGDAAARRSAYGGFMEMRARSLGADVYVFVNKTPGHLDVARRNDPKRSGLTEDGRRRMAGDLLAKFRDKQYDAALTGMTESLAVTYAAGPSAGGSPNTGVAAAPADPRATPPAAGRTAPADSSARTSGAAPAGDASDNKGFFGSLGCIGLVVIAAVVFLVITLIRRLFAGRQQQQNYGQGGPGGGYGAPGGYGPGQYGNNPGGGGGFGRGLGGGILGGLLGSWIGGNVFGQGHGSSSSGDTAAGGGATGGAADAGNDPNGFSSGGSDFDSGSGDYSSGGSDFSSGDSGGGDSGGGGDF